MNKVHTISNQTVALTVAERGAEMQSLRFAGRQVLWQGDAAYWQGRAPNLFPYVGRLWGGKYTLNGAEYSMGIHGFVKDSVLKAKQTGEHSLCFTLTANEATLKMYPYNFVYRVEYALHPAGVEVSYSVENHSAEPMYFGLGGHPGICVPLEEGTCFEDYRLRFSRPCSPRQVVFTQDKYVDANKWVDYPLQDKQILQLSHRLFDNDAIVLEHTSDGVRLERKGGGAAVEVEFAGFRYLGLWHTPGTDAPFLCIEPWTSLPGQQDEVTELTRQEDMVRLAPGGVYRNAWRMWLT